MASAAPQMDLVPSTEIAVTGNPGIVLMDREKFDAFYEGLKAKAPVGVDVSTKKGRDVLRSFAAEVRTQKAAIDKARLGLTKQWRDMTAQANAAGKEIEERLEGLAIEVRKPLTEWEEAEKAREAECRAVIDGFRAAKVITEDDTAATVRQRGSEVFTTGLDPARFGEMLAEAQFVKDDAVDTLKRALARLTQEEADRAELARLRAEREEADRLAAERAATEEAERQRAELERIAEERRKAAEEAEAQRIRDAEERAAQAARDEEARKAREAEEERERQHAAELAEQQRRAEEAERAAQAERDRRANEEAEAARQAEEARKREENRAHRQRVQKAAKEAIMTCGADEDTAKKVVLAIVAGDIPNVTLRF